MYRRPIFLLLSLFLLSFVPLAQSDDLQLLLSLKTSFQSSNSKYFTSWNPAASSPCNFTGVKCNFDNSVTELELSNQGLSGPLPIKTICQLSSLEKLSLGSNFLSGTVAQELNNCEKLKYLDLGNNFFTGRVPDISSMSQLQYLYLNNSGFSGSFPWKSLKNMTGLIRLSLGDNPFDQGSSFPSEVLELKMLNWLYMSNCSIGGTIPPGIGNLTGLINLELSDNYLTGVIPPEIGNLEKLWQLELYGNQLNGTFPAGFGRLINLENFDASMNHLQGNLFELRYLINLVSLQLFENELTGEVPVEFGDFKRLVNLSLYTNKLTGPLPQKLGSWTEFGFIDVSENAFTGLIPPDMCKGGKMFALLMLQNRFSGSIPESYGNCSTLRRFRVSNNSLTGRVPAGIWGLPAVNIIDIESNSLEGSITSDVKNAQALVQIFAAGNKLSGNIPVEISMVTSLISVDLSENQLTGDLPTSIGDLKQLARLHLENNRLSGPIPDSLGSCDSLTDLNLGKNLLSGPIPSSIGYLPALNALDLSKNQLSGGIPESLSTLRLSLLDLSDNKLTGRVPLTLSIEAYNGSFAGNPGLCSQNIVNFQRCSTDSGMSKKVRAVLICFLSALVILLVVLAILTYTKRSKKDQEGRSLRQDSWDVKSFHVLTFTEEEVIDAIKQENLIGKGGSGNVYRVQLPSGNDLAVKHIWNSDPWKKLGSTTPMLGSRGGKLPEFDAEVQTLSSIRHVNVVKLYCSITSEDSSLLVYEYMPNGSLWDRLHASQKMELDWDTRYEIALGAAKGLEYLHHGCERPVIHRDVKSSNILLDEFLKPRIADFGLAKIVQASDGSKDSTHVVAGTHGYIAPEYGYTYKINEKSDVYSFGVVLMELVTRKRPIQPEFGENKDIVNWVCSNLKTKESVLGLVDSKLSVTLKEEAIKVLKIAILCTARQPELRPTMRSVVQMLEEAEPCKLIGIIVSKNGSDKKGTGDDYTCRLSPDF